jgi:hypothetical protein
MLYGAKSLKVPDSCTGYLQINASNLAILGLLLQRCHCLYIPVVIVPGLIQEKKMDGQMQLPNGVALNEDT